jgi:hypothetical protein
MGLGTVADARKSCEACSGFLTRLLYSGSKLGGQVKALEAIAQPENAQRGFDG